MDEARLEETAGGLAPATPGYVRALRPGQPNALYHRDETALRHGAGARSTTTDPGEAYPSFDPREPGPPEPSGLPWA